MTATRIVSRRTGMRSSWIAKTLTGSRRKHASSDGSNELTPARSKQKGNEGERELARFLTEKGFPARRGVTEGKDISGGIPGFHIEAKRVERGNPYVWLDQAKKDAKEDEIPLVCHRRNNREWLAVLPLADFLDSVTVLDPLVLGRVVDELNKEKYKPHPTLQ